MIIGTKMNLKWALNTLCLVFVVQFGPVPPGLCEDGRKTFNFLSDTDPVYQYLEYLQGSINNTMKRPPFNYEKNTQEGLSQLRAKFNKLHGVDPDREALQELFGAMSSRPLPTRYEDALILITLDSLAKRIAAAAKASTRGLPYAPKYGSIPTKIIQPRVLQVPDSKEFLIVFDHDIFTFTSLMANAVIQLADVEKAPAGYKVSLSKQTVDDKLAHSHEAEKRFFDVLWGYVVKKDVASARPYLLEEPYHMLGLALADGANLFIVGHEYAHVILGHISEASSFSPGRLGFGPGAITVSEADHAKEREMEADEYGVFLTSKALQDSDGELIAMGRWGPTFMLTCMDILDQAQHMHQTGKDGRSSQATHPSGLLRRTNLRNLLGVRNESNMGAAIDYAAERMWEKAKPVFAIANKASKTR